VQARQSKEIRITLNGVEEGGREGGKMRVTLRGPLDSGILPRKLGMTGED
jgi:hypothetical protein